MKRFLSLVSFLLLCWSTPDLHALEIIKLGVDEIAILSDIVGVVYHWRRTYDSGLTTECTPGELWPTFHTVRTGPPREHIEEHCQLRGDIPWDAPPDELQRRVARLFADDEPSRPPLPGPDKPTAPPPSSNWYCTFGDGKRGLHGCSTPVRQAIRAEQHVAAVDNAMLEFMYARDPEFRRSYATRLNNLCQAFVSWNHANLATRIRARLAVLGTQLFADHEVSLRDVRNCLYNRYCDAYGRLCNLEPDHDIARFFAKFGKKALDKSTYCNVLSAMQGMGEADLLYQERGSFPLQVLDWCCSRPQAVWEALSTPEPCTTVEQVADNSFNNELLAYISLCENWKFDEARTTNIYKSQAPMRQIYDDQEKLYRAAAFDQYGLEKALAQDPLWHSMSANLKRSLMADPTFSQVARECFTIRSHRFHELENLFNFTSGTPEHRALLWNLVGEKNSTKRMELLYQACATDPALRALCFTSRGVCKEWRSDPLSRALPAACTLTPELEQEFNTLLALHHDYPDGEHAPAFERAAMYLSRALLPLPTPEPETATDTVTPWRTDVYQALFKTTIDALNDRAPDMILHCPTFARTGSTADGKPLHDAILAVAREGLLPNSTDCQSVHHQALATAAAAQHLLDKGNAEGAHSCLQHFVQEHLLQLQQTGPGMASAHRDHLLKLFETTPPPPAAEQPVNLQQQGLVQIQFNLGAQAGEQQPPQSIWSRMAQECSGLISSAAKWWSAQQSDEDNEAFYDTDQEFFDDDDPADDKDGQVTAILERLHNRTSTGREEASQAHIESAGATHTIPAPYTQLYQTWQTAYDYLIDDEGIYDESEAVEAARLERRLEALRALPTEPEPPTGSVHSFSPQAQDFMAQHGLKRSAYEQFEGTSIQQLLHTECVNLIHDFAPLASTPHWGGLQESAAACIDVARVYNTHALPDTGFKIIDFCWAVCDYTSALARGLWTGVKSSIHVATHPWEPAIGLIKIAGCLLHLNHLFTMVQCGSREHWNSACMLYLNPLRGTIEQVATDAKERSGPEHVEWIAAHATEWFLTPKLLTAMQPLYRAALVSSAAALRNAGRCIGTAEQLALALPEGIPLAIQDADMFLQAVGEVASGSTPPPAGLLESAILAEGSALTKGKAFSGDLFRNAQPHAARSEESLTWLQKHIGEYKETAPNKWLPDGGPKNSLRRARWADNYYNRVRGSRTDVHEIAKNLNCPVSVIRRIKRHLFYKKHWLDMYEEPYWGRYQSCPEIAAAWKRLRHNLFVAEDLQLLRHEFHEALYERYHCKNSYTTCHEFVEKKLGIEWKWPVFPGVNNP